MTAIEKALTEALEGMNLYLDEDGMPSKLGTEAEILSRRQRDCVLKAIRIEKQLQQMWADHNAPA